MADTTASAPSNLEAEESVLGACLLSGDIAADRAGELLAPRDFYRDSHGLIFSAVLALRRRGEPSEPLLVIRELERAGELDRAGGRGRVHELYAAVPASSNVGHHAHLVLEASRNRQLFKAASAVSTATMNGGLTLHPELLEQMKSAILEAEGIGEPERILPPLISARELCAEPDPDDGDVILGPLLARGDRTIVGARGTGQGKTTFCYWMISAVVNGTHFLRWKGEGGGSALIIDLEQGRRTTKKRLREVGLEDSAEVDLWLVPEGLALERDRTQRLVIERALQGSNYDIVLLDPHYKAHTGDTNDEQDVRAVMQHLDRWRAEWGFALMLPTHGRKLPSGIYTPPVLEDIAAGSGSIVRGAEIIFGLEVREKGLTKFYCFKHRDGDDSDELPLFTDPWTLSFSRDKGFGIIDMSTGPRKAPAEEIAEWIRSIGGRATRKDIIGEFEISDQAIRDRRETLAALGVEYRKLGRDSFYVARETMLAPDDLSEVTPPGAYDEPGAHDYEA